MKVLHIFHEIEFSGAELMLHGAAKNFQKKGIELHAIAAGPLKGSFAKEFETAGIKVYHMPMYRSLKNYLLFIPYYWNFIRFCRKNKFEVVHLQRARWFIWYAIAAKVAGINVIVRTIHSIFVPNLRYFQHYVDRKIASMLGVVAISVGSAVQKHEIEFFNNFTIRINNWVDNTQFYPAKNADEKEKIRISLDIPINKLVLMSIGACHPIKRHLDIIQSISMLGEYKDAIHYIHLGQGPTQDEEISKAKHLGVDPLITFLPRIDDVRLYLAASDVFIMSSEFEGLSIAALEAMSCGTCCIFNNIAGLRDLIPSKQHGFLIETTAQKLSKQIAEIITMDRSEIKKMGSRSSTFVRENFNLEKAVSHYVALYKSNSIKTPKNQVVNPTNKSIPDFYG